MTDITVMLVDDQDLLRAGMAMVLGAQPGLRIVGEAADGLSAVERDAELREREELQAIRPDLDGQAVMAHLGIPPGREVGEALSMLLEARLDEGTLDEADAYRRLDEWWAARQG